MALGSLPYSESEDIIDACVAAYESAQAGAEDVDLNRFLPTPDHPFYLAVLCELIRVDLEYRWERGQPRTMEEYLNCFPELEHDTRALQEIAFEEYRSSLLAGRNQAPEYYRQRYGVSISNWPTAESLRSAHPMAGDSSDAPLSPVSRDVHVDRGPALPEPPRCPEKGRSGERRAVAGLPEAGSEFLGFRLITELGRGRFGRVFLACQNNLAGRWVALKVGTEIVGEGQTLAQLQHTNIVPIYSAHREGRLQAVCMPYFGSTTLADLLNHLHGQASLPTCGSSIVRFLQERRLAGPSLRPQEGLAGQGRTRTETPPTPGEEARSFLALRTLEGYDHVQAILWIGARLADGLAHAHERGILHRDLKPANILLTDEGQPMLLDFNLSEDSKRSTQPVRMGGTLFYMAPEHLEAFHSSSGQIDGRSDLYSLGLILYELLTGKPPFPVLGGKGSDILPRLTEQRRQLPGNLRAVNRAVSPAAQAIVLRCLDPDPKKRYSSARAMQQDLDRQLANLPLQHTPEPTLRERGRKWMTRNPRLAALGGLSLVMALVVLLLGKVLLGFWQVQQSQEAIRGAEYFHREKAAVDLTLSTRDEVDAIRLREGIARARRVLDHYAVLDNPRWREAPALRSLPESWQEEIREEVADLLWNLSRATAHQAEGLDAGARQAQLQAALELNTLAGEALAPGESWIALRLQRAGLARKLGRPEEAQSLEKETLSLPPCGPRDRLLLAIRLREEGRVQDALPLLRQAIALLTQETALRPRDFRGWYLRGNCHDLLGESMDSITCYTVCIALAPESAEPYFNRAAAYARQRRWQQAGQDLDRFLALRSDLAEAYALRARAAEARNDLAGAEKDLTLALEREPSRTRFLFRRAAVRRKAGKLEGARRDQEEAMQRPPGDEGSWVDRGAARLPADPAGALADFDQALKVNPRYVPAWQNRAHVLSDHLQRPAEALTALDRAVALLPDFVPGRVGRGVLLARLGKRQPAHQEAREALARDPGPPTLYQAANIYALTSKENATDRLEAFALLSRALAGGFGLDVIDVDSDMDPIRGHPDFRRIVEAARALRAGGRSP